jgi:ectoine hydroxylase-related dioxygenase (phytanoyl-CoA dioxygenase family)
MPSPILDALASELAPCLDGESARGGARNLLQFSSVQSLARSEPVRAVAEAALGKGCFAVRGILFDKTAGANWKVVWHQDLTIAVKEQRDVEGFGTWSKKSGVPHAQAPDSILEEMIAVRVHLDDCGPDNGPVRVIPRSHTSGRLPPLQVEAWKAEHPVVECLVNRGGILAFFPLILHASSPATRPGHRRVVHLEFAARSLPGGLEWYNTVGV